MSRRCPSPRVVFATVALAVTAADQAGKAWAATRTGTGALGPTRFELVRNSGASFGLGRGLTVWITLVTLGAVAALTVIGWRARSTVWAVAVGLIAGGALGNATDRLTRAPGPLRGAVVDWIKLPFYGPVFNLADLALRGGALLAIGLLLRTATRGADDRPPPDPAPRSHAHPSGSRTTP